MLWQKPQLNLLKAKRNLWNFGTQVCMTDHSASSRGTVNYQGCRGLSALPLLLSGGDPARGSVQACGNNFGTPSLSLQGHLASCPAKVVSLFFFFFFFIFLTWFNSVFMHFQNKHSTLITFERSYSSQKTSWMVTWSTPRHKNIWIWQLTLDPTHDLRDHAMCFIALNMYEYQRAKQSVLTS